MNVNKAKNHMKRQRNSGFTLLEILTVVVIIGILLVLIVPNVVGRVDETRVTAAKSDIRSLGNALAMYRLDNGHYPSTSQGLDSLVRKPSGNPEPRQWGPEPYLNKVPTDPWGSQYLYENAGSRFEITSLGADADEGGSEYAADIRFSDL